MSAPATSSKVVLIGGTLRSGSTLLASAVNAADGHAAMGESNLAWTALANGQRCSCGAVGTRCPVWSQVLDGVVGDTGLSLPAIIDLEQRILRIRHLRKLLSQDLDDDVRAAVAVWRSLYRHFAEATGASVLIDSAKTPVLAALLAHMTELRPTLLHLIRSPAGVMYSETQRTSHRGERDDWQPPPRGAVSSAANWVSLNLLIEKVARLTQGRLSYRRVRYEDFLADPRETLSAALGAAAAGGIVHEREITAAGSHEIAGNPNRFDRGSVTIRAVDDGPGKLRRDRRIGATIVTTAIGFRYRYTPAGRLRNVRS